MVVGEALANGIPVIASDIAGITEMISDGVEGFLVTPGDNNKTLACMAALAGADLLNAVCGNTNMCLAMGSAGRKRYDLMFDMKHSVYNYRELISTMAPATVLVDMDGTLVDWDTGFMRHWNDIQNKEGQKVAIDRTVSYHMEYCVPSHLKVQCENLFLSKDFFLNLPPMVKF